MLRVVTDYTISTAATAAAKRPAILADFTLPTPSKGTGLSVAAVVAGTVKVAMPPVGAETVTVLLFAPALTLEAADMALEKLPYSIVVTAVTLDSAPPTTTEPTEVDTGTSVVMTIVESAGQGLTVEGQLVTVMTVVVIIVEVVIIVVGAAGMTPPTASVAPVTAVDTSLATELAAETTAPVAPVAAVEASFATEEAADSTAPVAPVAAVEASLATEETADSTAEVAAETAEEAVEAAPPTWLVASSTAEEAAEEALSTADATVDATDSASEAADEAALLTADSASETTLDTSPATPVGTTTGTMAPVRGAVMVDWPSK